MRRPNLRGGLVDMGLAVIALIAGWVGAPWLAAGAIFALAASVWWWTRRHALARLSQRQLLAQGGAALAVLAIVLGLFYWLGLALGGHT